jgi:hypothetical protein
MSEATATQVAVDQESINALISQMIKMQERIEELSKVQAKSPASVKLDTTKKYERLGELDGKGSVPQQQKDIATVLSLGMELDTKYSEEDMVGMLEECKSQFTSLLGSKQPLVRLLRYYLGNLNNPGKPNHYGFVERGFIAK